MSTPIETDRLAAAIEANTAEMAALRSLLEPIAEFAKAENARRTRETQERLRSETAARGPRR